jgi:hypothetical protein
MPNAREWFGVLASASPWRKEPPDQRAEHLRREVARRALGAGVQRG